MSNKNPETEPGSDSSDPEPETKSPRQGRVKGLLLLFLPWLKEWRNQSQDQNSILSKIYVEIEVPLGILCLVLGGMQNQLYAWSHDFAGTGFVGIPVGFNKDGAVSGDSYWDFTGAEWEYFNVIFALGSAIILTMMGGYFIGNSMRRMRIRKLIWKNLANRERKLNAFLKEIIQKSHMTKAKKTAILEATSPSHNALEQALLETEEKLEEEAEKSFAHQYPLLEKLQNFLQQRYALPLALLIHVLVLGSIHLAWARSYYQDEDYIGPVEETIFWNWMWFAGVYTTFTFLALSSYAYYYDENNSRAKRKLERLQKKSKKLQKKKPEIMKMLNMLSDEQKSIKTKISLDIDLYDDEGEPEQSEPITRYLEDTGADERQEKRRGMVIKKRKK